jgi:hypothetical protein
MSQVFECECGRKTTEPFIIKGRRYCTVCAEDIWPDVVESRERHNLRQFGRRPFAMDRQNHDYGKHR